MVSLLPNTTSVGRKFSKILGLDHRGVNLISDALPFGRLWYGEPDAVSKRS